MLSVLADPDLLAASATAQANEKHDGKFRHDPDAIAEKYVVRRFDETEPSNTALTGPDGSIPDDDTSELKSPSSSATAPMPPR